jgi:hypothetical protein
MVPGQNTKEVVFFVKLKYKRLTPCGRYPWGQTRNGLVAGLRKGPFRLKHRAISRKFIKL